VHVLDILTEWFEGIAKNYDLRFCVENNERSVEIICRMIGHIHDVTVCSVGPLTNILNDEIYSYQLNLYDRWTRCNPPEIKAVYFAMDNPDELREAEEAIRDHIEDFKKYYIGTK
jgi:hypothetical protein